MAVDAEGLRLFTPEGASRPLNFGMEQSKLLGALEPFRGPADTGTNEECGAGALDYAVWADGLTLHFQDGRFVGWMLDARAAGAHATASGIGPGSTRASLEEAYEADVAPSSLGVEFEAGGLGGLLGGTDPDDPITSLWAGVTCLFR